MSEKTVERRLHERTKVDLDGSVSETDAISSCRVINFSQGGIQVAGDMTYDVGETIEIMIPNLGRFHGVVAWAKDGAMGIEFRTPNFEAAVMRKAPQAGLDPF